MVKVESWNVDMLSPREKQVVDLLLLGKSNKQIGLALGVSERTIEFHLKNIYIKMQVTSRVELILKLGQPTGVKSAHLVEPTVDFESKKIDNGNQPMRSRWANSLRNTVSLIKQEIAMTIKISFEDLNNYLKTHPTIFGILLFAGISFATRYVTYGVGLFFWLSYLVLGLSIGIGSIYLGLSWKKIFNKSTNLLTLLIVITLIPFIATAIDQLYINLILPNTAPISTTIAGITAEAMWIDSYRSTHLSITSDLLWLVAIAYMLVLFLIGYISKKHFEKNNLAIA